MRIAILLVVSHLCLAEHRQIAEERQYEDFVESIGNFESPKISQGETKLFVDALWDSVLVNPPKTFSEIFLGINQTGSFALADQIRLEVLQNWPALTHLSDKTISRILSQDPQKSDSRALLTLLAHQDQISDSPKLIEELKHIYRASYDQWRSLQVNFRAKTKKEIQDLYFNTPDLADYKKGRYKNGVRIFMFCRYSRKYKCIILLKDKDDRPVYLDDNRTLWHQPALGMSKFGLPSWRRNGNTPEGVFRIDGVMPEANKRSVYGKYRRLIMDFVEKSEDESTQKTLLPSSAHDKNWWKSAVVARDIGRNLLRIHGTGTKGSEPADPHHPLRPTLGCVMKRELTFGDVSYHDQRHLLDKLMAAQGLEVKFENEAKLLGMLYIIELDKTKRSVTYEDIKDYLEIN